MSYFGTAFATPYFGSLGTGSAVDPTLPIIVIQNDESVSGASAVSICSNALILLGDAPIDSFDDDAKRAQVVSNLYTTVRKAVLRDYPWGCCTKRVVLSPDVDQPAFDYGYQFSLPGDCIRILSIDTTSSIGLGGGSAAGAGAYYGAARRGWDLNDYAVEGKKILANRGVVYLRYVFDNLIESTWDDLLVNAMTLAMAMRACYAITASTSLYQMLAQDYAQALKRARGADSQEGPAITLGDFPLLSSRY